ncbi:CoA transferase [Mycobacterium sp.]|jgi:crotonobetainyl-CoA:carnitine CoA-transferase CaiB-like acyl-CoA transferase|uniref:CaiB/BaiF CoA transferase family protein n=1 Tax=Mycobacterium sp. TaxID=1785 RepID=UPI00260BDC11|nr:CoA transferase [Mycobacterium sp.]
MPVVEPPPSPPPLDGFTVVELSSGIAGGYCTKLLVDAGAHVVKLEDPSGDALRRWSASGASIAAGADGPLFQYLSASKRSVVLDPDDISDIDRARDIISNAHAVVWSPDSGLAKHPRLAPEGLHADAPDLVVTAITPFGLDGPWAGQPASDLTLQAWSGGIWARGFPERPPVYVGGRQDQWAAGIVGGVATLIGRIAQIRTGHGQLIDISVLEALCQWLFGYSPITCFDAAGTPLKSKRSVHVPGVEETSDGYVGTMVGTGQQWLDFCAMVEHPEWADDPALLRVDTRSDNGSAISALITKWTSARTTDDVRELASAFLIPNSPIGNGKTIPQFDHFVARKAFVENPTGGFLQPALPYTLHGVPMRDFGRSPALGESTGEIVAADRWHDDDARPSNTCAGLPLSGIRVLDLTSLFAGPFFTRLLGMFGAEVIHLESVGRPDLYRMYSLRQVGREPQWQEWVPNFAGANTNKLGLTLDLRTARGRELFLDLTATCDVVVENFSARVMDNLKLGYEELRSRRPDLIMVRMPGFGLDGPWRDVPAFAPIIEDASGITWLTGYPDEKPQEAQSVGDPNAALHALAATLIALLHRHRAGEGTLVEAPMIGAALNVAAEQVIEYSAFGHTLTRNGNRGTSAAPQGLYLSTDIDEFGRLDCWVAIAVETEDQWCALRHLIPEVDPTAALNDIEARRQSHDAIDAGISRWCASRSAEDIVKQLWSAGVPVGKVIAPHRQADIAQLQARRFFETLDHPVLGRARYDTFPARFSAGPSQYNRAPAPTLGQHNAAILAALGCCEADLRDLEHDGVIGTEPKMG